MYLDSLFKILCVAALLFPVGTKAQKRYSAQDSTAIYRLLDLADELDFAGQIPEAMMAAREALRQSKTKRMLRGEGFANLKIADLLLKQTEHDQLEYHYREGLHAGQVLRDSFLLGLGYLQQAQYMKTVNRYDEAIAHLHKATQFLSEQTHAEYAGLAYNEQGFIEEKKGNYVQAAVAYLKAIQLFELLHYDKELANSLNNLAIVHYRMNDRQACIHTFRQCLAIQQRIGDVKRIAATAGNLATVYTPIHLDSALYYQEIALQHAQRTGLDAAMAQAYQNKAALLSRKKMYRQALEAEQEAIRLFERIGDQSKLVPRFISCANICEELKEPLQAAGWLDKAKKLAEALESKPLLLEAYQARSAFHQRQGDFEAAFADLKRSNAYRDSLLDEKTKTAISELQIRYETEKKDLQLIQQQKQLQIQQLLGQKKDDAIRLLQREQEIQLASLAQVRLEKRNQELLRQASEQSLTLANQEVALLEKDNLLRQKQLQRQRSIQWMTGISGILGILIAFLWFSRLQLRRRILHQNALLEVRNRIAKDLHDEIGSTLTSISILSAISRQSMADTPQQASDALEQISQQSRTIQQKMSDIVWAIRPGNERIQALTARMREYSAKTLEPLNMTVRFEAEETLLDETLSVPARKEALLIFKEALSNIVKHAGASEVHIRCAKEGQRFRLSITDNGSWKGGPESTGMGLHSMRERAQEIGAMLHVRPNANGTEVLLEIPIA